MPVSHFPREAGEQSGANLKVIVRSLFGLVRLRLSLVRAPAGAPGLPSRTARGSAD